MINFRTPRAWVSIALASTLSLVGIAATAPTTQANGGVSPAKLGMYVGFDQGDRFADMERRLELPIRWVLTMAGKKSPSDMVGSVWGQLTRDGAYLPTVADRVNLIMSVPVGFGPGGIYKQPGGREAVRSNLLAVASGRHDDSYRRVARNLVAAGFDDAILRLGHEFDGIYEPYTARENNDAYIAAFRRVHDIFARESPAFKFEWTSMRSNFRQYGPPAYPGDHYVDIVGLDIYYRSSGPITDRIWENQYLTVLTAHRDFAASRGKPVSYAEWGRGMANESRFVDLMHGWFSSLADQGPGGLVYHSYFNEKKAGYDLNTLPAVRDRYVELFGREGANRALITATPSPAPTPTPSPTPTPLPSPTPTSEPETSPPPTAETPIVTTVPQASAPSISLLPRTASLELTWFYPGDEKRNVRYKAVGSSTWTWVRNGAWNQVISGLRSGVSYEVQARAFAEGAWQPWITATATTN